MRRIKIPQQDFALKMQGAYERGGAYLWDTTVLILQSQLFLPLFGNKPKND